MGAPEQPMAATAVRARTRDVMVMVFMAVSSEISDATCAAFTEGVAARKRCETLFCRERLPRARQGFRPRFCLLQGQRPGLGPLPPLEDYTVGLARAVAVPGLFEGPAQHHLGPHPVDRRR